MSEWKEPPVMHYCSHGVDRVRFRCSKCEADQMWRDERRQTREALERLAAAIERLEARLGK